MKKLRARLYSMHLEEETTKRYNARKIQVKMNLRNTKTKYLWVLWFLCYNYSCFYYKGSNYLCPALSCFLFVSDNS